jgi:MOSC domain-containing protein YiiM
MGFIEGLCISKKKGRVKKEVDSVNVLTEWGIEGDAHAGCWHRQISLLQGESIDKMKKVIPRLAKGAFAENIITRGIDLSQLNVGDRLVLGVDVLAEITQIGKDCHTSCIIRDLIGDCIMPKEGLFARIIKGGPLNLGNVIQKIDHQREILDVL